MAKRQKTSGPSRTVALDLTPDRAFVLHLDARACPPRRMLGRVEHVASGRVAHVTSVRGLLTFLIDVLRESGEGETIEGRDER